MLDRELFLLPFDFLALDSSSVKWPFWLFPSLSASAWSILDTSRDNVYKLSPVSCPVLQKCRGGHRMSRSAWHGFSAGMLSVSGGGGWCLDMEGVTGCDSPAWHCC